MKKEMKKILNNIKIKKGDTVKILYGKDRGRRGTVVAINPKSGKLIVEGLNLYKKHLKGDGRTRTSEILTIEKPLPLSKVMLVCPLCDKPTRVGIEKKEDKKTRICKKCGKEITKGESKEVKKEKKSESKEKTKTKTKPKKEDSKKTKSKTKSKGKK